MERETHALNQVLRREVWSKEVLKALQEPLVITALALGLYLALTYWSLPLTSLLMLGLLFNRSINGLNKIQRQYQKMVASESALWSLRSTIERSENAREVIHGLPLRPLPTRLPCATSIFPTVSSRCYVACRSQFRSDILRRRRPLRCWQNLNRRSYHRSPPAAGGRRLAGRHSLERR